MPKGTCYVATCSCIISVIMGIATPLIYAAYVVGVYEAPCLLKISRQGVHPAPAAMENFIFHSLILFFDWRCITLLFAVQLYRTGTLSASSLRSALGGVVAATEQPFMAAQAFTPCDAQGCCAPLDPRQG